MFRMKRSTIMVKSLSGGLHGNTRKLSEFFHPFPSTSATPDGLYLMHAVKDSEFSTVKAALESGVNPNFRSEEVRNHCFTYEHKEHTTLADSCITQTHALPTL